MLSGLSSPMGYEVTPRLGDSSVPAGPAGSHAAAHDGSRNRVNDEGPLAGPL